MSYEVSERGGGGALFAATLMIIAGAFGILQGIALIAKGTFYVQPANYWIDTGAVHLGLVAPHRRTHRPRCGVRGDLRRGMGSLAWHRRRRLPGHHKLPVHPRPALVVDHPDPCRPVGYPRSLRAPA